MLKNVGLVNDNSKDEEQNSAQEAKYLVPSHYPGEWVVGSK
jgi:hypothetical protein